MSRSTLRLAAVPALVAFVAMSPVVMFPGAASAQGFLDNLFGNSDRFSSPPSAPQEPQQPAQYQQPQYQQQQPQYQQPQYQQPQEYGGRGQGGGQGGGGEITTRINRLEAQIRELTGAIEQLQHRNQQLEAQVRGMQGGGGPPARGPAQPQVQPQMQPPQQSPPPAGGGRRGEGVFDPAQHPNAPGAPRTLGTIPSGGAPAQPYSGAVAQSDPDDDDEVGAPGGRGAGAPLDLSTTAPSQPGMPQPEPRGAPSRGQGGGTQLATLPPTDSPRDSYDLAYGYVMRKDYALADQGFRNFLRRFPSDRLVPEAQYWLGESMFQRQLYRDAAEQFLAVSTKFETNARAPDALLRLGQSLAAMGEKEAACASLAEVTRKYPRASVSVRQGVEREQKRVRC